MRRLLIICAFLAGCAARDAGRPPDPAGMPPPEPQALATPADYALDALGARYRYGGRTPETGFDCSGLVAHVYQQAWGLALPRNAEAQSRIGRRVRLAELAPGDLLFYNTQGRPHSHVGIYVGDRRFVHAPKPGGRVRLESIDASYWRIRFDGARRIEPGVAAALQRTSSRL